MCSRWTHFQRSVSHTSDLFESLENAIRDQLFPTREVCDAQRQLLALPLRHGGLGLTNPQTTAKCQDHVDHCRTNRPNLQPKTQP